MDAPDPVLPLHVWKPQRPMHSHLLFSLSLPADHLILKYQRKTVSSLQFGVKSSFCNILIVSFFFLIHCSAYSSCIANAVFCWSNKRPASWEQKRTKCIKVFYGCWSSAGWSIKNLLTLNVSHTCGRFFWIHFSHRKRRLIFHLKQKYSTVAVVRSIKKNTTTINKVYTVVQQLML